MRSALFLLVVALPLAMGVRDKAFWTRLLHYMVTGKVGVKSTASPTIIANVAAEFNGFIKRFDLSNDKRIAHFLGQVRLFFFVFFFFFFFFLFFVCVVCRGECRLEVD